MSDSLASLTFSDTPARTLATLLYAHSRDWYLAKPTLSSRGDRVRWLWARAAEASARALAMGKGRAPGYRGQALFAGVLSRAAAAYALLGDHAEVLAVAPASNWLQRLDTSAILIQVLVWRLADWWSTRPRLRDARAECDMAFRAKAIEPAVVHAFLFAQPSDPTLN